MNPNILNITHLLKNKLQPDGCETLSNVIWIINMFIPLLLIRYHLLFAANVDLNSKKVIDSHLITILLRIFDVSQAWVVYQKRI